MLLPISQVPEAVRTLIHEELDVNSWADLDPDVDVARPSHCVGCGRAAHAGGRLRLHGHGRRARDLWGPVAVGGVPEMRTLLLRRYRCVDCRAVCTVLPRGVVRRFQYAATAIASALLLWATWLWTAALTRAAISPHRKIGVCEPERWRSLTRWSRRAAELFRLPGAVHGATAREAARRVVHVLIARGPPGLDEHHRAVVGARAR